MFKKLIIFFLSLVCLSSWAFDPLIGNQADFFNQDILPIKKISQNSGFLEFTGTHYELGLKLGQAQRSIGVTLKKIKKEEMSYQLASLKLISKLYPEWIEFRKGIAKAYDLNYEQAKSEFELTVNMTNIDWFGCSGISVNGKLTADGHNYLARNYDFPRLKFIMQRLNLKGKYSYMGHNMLFGYPILMDGLNEKGVVVEINAVTDSINMGIERQAAPNYGTVAISSFICYLLENCASVNEAVKAINDFPLYPFGVRAHYLISDKNGNSVLVEFNEDNHYKPVFYYRKANYQIMTNFNHITLGYRGNMGYIEGSCRRYEILQQKLSSIKSRELTTSSLFQIIDMVKMSSEQSFNFSFDSTIWQVVYDLNNLTAYERILDEDFSQIHVYKLK